MSPREAVVVKMFVTVLLDVKFSTFWSKRTTDKLQNVSRTVSHIIFFNIPESCCKYVSY